ncbi:reverse transcriptase domain-containing protein [Tanacetum coccineum]|uniref:Reverse transcriptase domain-containing protein n=1 Tax=Tanacetum coccineum TaxID=301880 RepID=A0ABQ5CVY2_9ASTR
MRTRSQARKRRQQQVRQTSVESPNLEKPNNNQETFNHPIVTMADNRTMAQLLEAPTEGYEDAIVVPEITANNFEIKHGLLNLVQNKQFFGHDKEDPHAHIRYFNKITSTMKFPNVPSTSVKLMLFPFSLEGAARIWLEKEPPRSILTWDDLVSKFINKFFPPSKTTNLRNEITRFQQKFDETFYEAWDRFNDLLRGCPHHGFSELHQLDTFYNALNSNDQDSLNSAAGGNFLDKMPRECLKIIESKSKVRQSRSKAIVSKVSTSSSTPAVSSDVAELKDMVRALILDKKNQTPAPAPVKAVEQNYVTCGGGNSYQNCPATESNIYRDNIQEYVSQAVAVNYNQGNGSYRPQMVANQIRPPGFPPMQNHQNNQNRGNNFNQNRGNNFNQGQVYQPQINQPPTFQAPPYQAPVPPAPGSGSLPSNTIANPKGVVKPITTRSGVSYNGPQISSLPKEMENEPKVTQNLFKELNVLLYFHVMVKYGAITSGDGATASTSKSLNADFMDNGATWSSNKGPTSNADFRDNGATSSSNKGPVSFNDINMVTLRNSFTALNEEDKVFENVDTSNAGNDGNISKDATKVEDDTYSDVEDVYDETARFMSSSAKRASGSGGANEAIF